MPSVHCVDELPELVERSRELVELGHRRIDSKEICRGKRTAVFAHDGIGCRHGERRKRLDDAKAHPVHDVVETPRDFAERAELSGKDGIDRVVGPRFRTLYLDVEIAALRPLGNVRPFRKETRLAREDADFVERDVGLEDARSRLDEGNVSPRAGKRRLSPLGLGDDFSPAHAGAAYVRAERRTPLARCVKRERHRQDVAAPLEKKRFGSRGLDHRQSAARFISLSVVRPS